MAWDLTGNIKGPAGSGEVPSGLLAVRPLAADFGPGLYFATDEDGGTLYRSDGVAWSQVAPGVSEPAGLELGYTELTATLGGLSSTGLADLTGLAVPFTVGARPIRAVLNIPLLSNNTAGHYLGAFIYIGAKEWGRGFFTSVAANGLGSLSVRARPVPALAPGNYTAQAKYLVSGGTETLNADNQAISKYGPSLQVLTC